MKTPEISAFAGLGDATNYDTSTRARRTREEQSYFYDLELKLRARCDKENTGLNSDLLCVRGLIWMIFFGRS